MTFYQELQLNQAGSKSLIRNTEDRKEKRRHMAVYLIKIALTMVFCVMFVTAYSMIFGNSNSIAGVIVLLCLMVFRYADFGVKTGSGLMILGLEFFLLAAGPRIANAVHPLIGLLINAGAILLILLLGCHHVIMANHSTLVLGYLLLYGYDVSGTAYLLRLAGLAAGAVLTGIVYYRNHKKETNRRTIKDLLAEIRPDSMRTRWQFSLAAGVSSAMCIMEILGLPRAMWAGIAAMSVMLPFEHDQKERLKGRIPGNIAGGILFILTFAILPDTALPYAGVIGGIGVGLSATYRWQSVFNSFGAMAVASGLIGFKGAVFYRIVHNILGALYGHAFSRLWNRLTDFCFRKVTDKASGTA